jgi:hypothetical protein
VENARIDAAFAQAQPIMATAAAIDGVIAVQVGWRASFDPSVASGPELLIHAERPALIEDAIANGILPSQLVTRWDVVPVRVLEGVITLDSGPPVIERERPIQPGASFGSQSPGGTGTYGALVQDKNQPAALTAGHVVGYDGADVFQPGPDDRAPDGTTKVGTVKKNAYQRAAASQHGVDAALVQIPNPDDINDVPHYTPKPSPQNPATGLYVGRNNVGQLDEQLVFLDIDTVLAEVGASMRAQETAVAKVGDRVVGSGRTSGIVDGNVTSVGVVVKDGARARGFMASRNQGGTGGDSGTVVVVRGETGYVWDTLDSGETVAIGYAEETEEHWLDPSLLGPLLGKQQGSQELEKDLNVTSDGLRSIVDAVKNTLKRLLGDLKIEVHALGTPHPCTAGAPAATTATACEVRISRENGSIDVRPAKPPPPAEPDPVRSETTCCSFGAQPSVSVSGDDSEDATVSLDLTATVSIRIHISAKQVVSDASFRRTGSCWTNRCGKERISGVVLAQRTQTIEIEATAGSLHLPGLGKIEAGKGAAKKETKTTVRKDFVLQCSAK